MNINYNIKVILVLVAFVVASCNSKKQDLRDASRIGEALSSVDERSLEAAINFVEDKNNFSVSRANVVYSLADVLGRPGSDIPIDAVSCSRWLADKDIRIAVLYLLERVPDLADKETHEIVMAIIHEGIRDKNKTLLASAWSAIFSLTDNEERNLLFEKNEFITSEEIYGGGDGSLRTIVNASN